MEQSLHMCQRLFLKMILSRSPWILVNNCKERTLASRITCWGSVIKFDLSRDRVHFKMHKFHAGWTYEHGLHCLNKRTST